MLTNPSRHGLAETFYNGKLTSPLKKDENADITAPEDDEAGPFNNRNGSVISKKVNPKKSSELY